MSYLDSMVTNGKPREPWDLAVSIGYYLPHPRNFVGTPLNPMEFL